MLHDFRKLQLLCKSWKTQHPASSLIVTAVWSTLTEVLEGISLSQCSGTKWQLVRSAFLTRTIQVYPRSWMTVHKEDIIVVEYEQYNMMEVLTVIGTSNPTKPV